MLLKSYIYNLARVELLRRLAWEDHFLEKYPDCRIAELERDRYEAEVEELGIMIHKSEIMPMGTDCLMDEKF